MLATRVLRRPLFTASLFTKEERQHAVERIKEGYVPPKPAWTPDLSSLTAALKPSVTTRATSAVFVHAPGSTTNLTANVVSAVLAARGSTFEAPKGVVAVKNTSVLARDLASALDMVSSERAFDRLVEKHSESLDAVTLLNETCSSARVAAEVFAQSTGLGPAVFIIHADKLSQDSTAFDRVFQLSQRGAAVDALSVVFVWHGGMSLDTAWSTRDHAIRKGQRAVLVEYPSYSAGEAETVLSTRGVDRRSAHRIVSALGGDPPVLSWAVDLYKAGTSVDDLVSMIVTHTASKVSALKASQQRLVSRLLSPSVVPAAIAIDEFASPSGPVSGGLVSARKLLRPSQAEADAVNLLDLRLHPTSQDWQVGWSSDFVRRVAEKGGPTVLSEWRASGTAQQETALEESERGTKREDKEMKDEAALRASVLKDGGKVVFKGFDSSELVEENQTSLPSSPPPTTFSQFTTGPSPSSSTVASSSPTPSSLSGKAPLPKTLLSPTTTLRLRTTFAFPSDVAVGPNGHIHVADAWSKTYRVFDENGNFLPAESHNDDATMEPRGICVDDEGQVYVSCMLSQSVQVFNRRGKRVRSLWKDAVSAEPAFSYPHGLAWNRLTRQLYVVDSGANRVTIVDSDAASVEVLRTLGADTTAATGNRFSLSDPRGCALDPLTGDLYVADKNNQRLQKITADGKWQALAPYLDRPHAVAICPVTRCLVVADTYNHCIRFVDRMTGAELHEPLTQVVGGGLFRLPEGIAVLASGKHFVVCDTGNAAVWIVPMPSLASSAK